MVTYLIIHTVKDGVGEGEGGRENENGKSERRRAPPLKCWPCSQEEMEEKSSDAGEHEMRNGGEMVPVYYWQTRGVHFQPPEPQRSHYHTQWLQRSLHAPQHAGAPAA